MNPGALPFGLPKRLSLLCAVLFPLCLSFGGADPAHAQTRERAVSGAAHGVAEVLEFDRVKLLQKILLARGHDIGAVDGAWGGRTRRAVNVERAALGLGPAQNLGPTTRRVLFTLPEASAAGGLPEPGHALIDLDARRAFLSQNPSIAQAYCTNPMGHAGLSARMPRIISVGPDGVHEGKTADSLPWYQSLAQGYSVESDACLTGDGQACQTIVDHLQLFVDLWGLRPAIDRQDPAFEPLAAQANIALSAMVSAFSTARHFIDIPPRQEEAITDFLFGRVTIYKRVVRRNEALPDRFRFGHSAAQLSVLPVLTTGALTGDPRTFYEGLDLYEFALDNTRVEGSIREDSLTGDMALMQEAALLSAMLVAVLRAEQQDVDLGSITRMGRDIHDLAGTVLDHLEDWDSLKRYASAQRPSYLNPARETEEASSFYVRDMEHLLAWTVLYAERFPRSPVTERIAALTLDPRTCGRLAERHGKAPWTCYRALAALSTEASVIMPAPGGSLFIGFNPGCFLATQPSPFTED